MKAKTKSEAVSDFRRNRKLNLLQVAGNKCCLCGYNNCISALEFHHIDPNSKSYGIASNGTCHNIQKDLEEIKKCVLVCANCHREIHEGYYDEKILWDKQIFDNDFAKSLTQLKKDTKFYCKHCNKEITHYSKTGLCSDCVKILRRKCDRPSREELKLLIQKESFVKIGEIYNVSDNSIRKWCI